MFREVYLAAIVFVGAGIGGVLRHVINRVTPLLVAVDFPAGTLIINITGSLMMGLLTGWFTFRGEQSPQALRLFLTTGILGGFTTFSAFSLDSALLWQRGAFGAMAAYLIGSVGLSLLAVFGGLVLARSILS